jgi:mono/diheme cytochrome c family protein
MKSGSAILFGCAALAAGAAGLAWAEEGPALVARGQSSFQQRCTQCHPPSKALLVSKGREGWRRTVVRMADRHLRVFDEEILADDQGAIISYLVATAGPNKGW